MKMKTKAVIVIGIALALLSWLGWYLSDVIHVLGRMS